MENGGISPHTWCGISAQIFQTMDACLLFKAIHFILPYPLKWEAVPNEVGSYNAAHANARQGTANENSSTSLDPQCSPNALLPRFSVFQMLRSMLAVWVRKSDGVFFRVWCLIFFFLTEHLLVEWYLDYVAIFLARDKDGPAKGRKVITIIGNEL